MRWYADEVENPLGHSARAMRKAPSRSNNTRERLRWPNKKVTVFIAASVSQLPCRWVPRQGSGVTAVISADPPKMAEYGRVENLLRHALVRQL